MNAKIQKEFTLTIGTNDENATEEQLTEKVASIERALNTSNPNIRVHIFDKSV